MGSFYEKKGVGQTATKGEMTCGPRLLSGGGGARGLEGFAMQTSLLSVGTERPAQLMTSLLRPEPSRLQ